MMRRYALACVVLIIVIVPQNEGIVAQSPIISSQELMGKTELNFTASQNHSIRTIQFTIPLFRDITLLEIVQTSIEEDLKYIELSVTVNSIQKTKVYGPDQLKSEKLLLLVDSQAMLAPQYPANVFTIEINASFVDPLIKLKEPYLTLSLESIILHTAYQQDPFPDQSKKDADSFRKEAAFIPNFYYSKVKDSFLNFKTNTIYAFLILPREINRSYLLNVTITSNVEVEYRSIVLEHFGIRKQTTENNNQIIEFGYVKDQSYPLTVMKIEIFPVAGVDCLVEIEGYFTLTSTYSLFEQSEFDLILFVVVTAIIPPLFLSKFLYKRLQNIT